MLDVIMSELTAAIQEPNTKVRWNGCYGIGNVLSNPAFATIFSSVEGRLADAIKALSTALQHDENFKVLAFSVQPSSTQGLASTPDVMAGAKGGPQTPRCSMGAFSATHSPCWGVAISGKERCGCRY